MRRSLLVLVLSFALPVSASAQGAELVALLSAYERAPSRAELDTAAGENVATALVALARDPGQLRLVRGRALNALAHYPGDDTRAFVAWLLLEEDDVFLLGRAVVLVARLGDDAPRWATQRLAPLANHPDTLVRRHVIDTLVRVRAHPDARHAADELLMQMALAERDAAVSDHLRATLRGLGRLTPEQTAQISAR